MLKHAYKIKAEEDYQKAITSLAATSPPRSKQQFLDSYKKLIDDDASVNDAIIKEDQRKLEALFPGLKKQNGRRR